MLEALRKQGMTAQEFFRKAKVKSNYNPKGTIGFIPDDDKEVV